MQKLPTAVISIGLVLLLLSIITGWLIGPYILEDQIIKNTRLENGSYTWTKWASPTNKMFLKVYIFNISNPVDVVQGLTPEFQELGPYTYEQKRYKENIEFDPESDTISYVQPVWFRFREDLSVGSEDDAIVFINLPLVHVSHRLTGFSAWIKYLMGMFLIQYREPLFVRRSVAQLLFTGYYSPMVDELQRLTGEKIFEKAIVGMLVGRNGSHEGTFEVNAGNKDYSRFGEIVSWNDKNRTDWPGEPCSMINGSDGSILPPMITRKSILRGFHPDVCRSFYVKYVKDITFSGVDGFRFEAPEEQYMSPKHNPDNWCYCSTAADDGDNFRNCFEDGVMSGSVCHKRDSPLTISNPHFLYAPYYLNLTRGLNPDKELHALFAEVEPSTGLILRAARRMQINVNLKRNGAIAGMRNVPEIQYPLIWVDESIYIDSEMHDEVLSLFLIMKSLVEVGRWVLFGFGACIAIIGVVVSTKIINLKDKKASFCSY